MAVEHSAAPQPSTSAVTLSGTSFEQRWAAWEAKGAAHDRAFRRKLALAAPLVMIIAAIIVFALFRRTVGGRHEASIDKWVSKPLSRGFRSGLETSPRGLLGVGQSGPTNPGAVC